MLFSNGSSPFRGALQKGNYSAILFYFRKIFNVDILNSQKYDPPGTVNFWCGLL
jgi:phosphoenolpyruvate carboxylase